MWIIQEPKKLALWNKRHFEEEKRRVCSMFKIFSTYICWIYKMQHLEFSGAVRHYIYIYIYIYVIRRLKVKGAYCLHCQCSTKYNAYKKFLHHINRNDVGVTFYLYFNLHPKHCVNHRSPKNIINSLFAWAQIARFYNALYERVHKKWHN